MAEHAAIEVISALQLLDHHILGMVVALLTQHGLMEAGIERLPLHPHRRDAQLLEHLDQLLVEALVAAMQVLGLLALGSELLAGAIEIVDDRQDLAEGGTGDLQLQVVVVAALTLAEVVEVGGDAHVLAAQALVFALQGSQLSLELLNPIRVGGLDRRRRARWLGTGHDAVVIPGLTGLGQRWFSRRLGGLSLALELAISVLGGLAAHGAWGNSIGAMLMRRPHSPQAAEARTSPAAGPGGGGHVNEIQGKIAGDRDGEASPAAPLPTRSASPTVSISHRDPAMKPEASSPPPQVVTALRSSLIGDLNLGIGQVPQADASKPEEDLETSSQAALSPVMSLVDRILIEALTNAASDIHVEPQEEGLQIRFRQDGVLRLVDTLPRTLIPAVTSRLKIMADLDIAERRMPQDGRIRRNFRGRTMDFRVSTLPSRHGEKVVMRLLDSGATQLGLDTLISDGTSRQMLRDLGSKPFGMILVTGPTGSGKSTTLYALLAERNEPGVNISTVEDPIEYTLQGITQTQVNREKGFDFSTALRAFMRQDPDVLLVGETRDLETARTAIEASLTGHLVLTTLHCNDAASAFARLDEMGVEPFLVSASLLGVISQRLVRRLCISCREPYHPDSEELARFGLITSDEQRITFYRATKSSLGTSHSCPSCQGRGYSGRIGVYEILTMNESLSSAVARRSNTEELRRLALENGMKTLLGYGLDLVREGLTTLEEVERMLLTDTGLESERRARALNTLTCRGCGAGLQDEWLECPYCLRLRT